MAEAIGISIASYIRLEQGKDLNPPIGWLVNASDIFDCPLEELIEAPMRAWHRFRDQNPPPPEWLERPEVVARAKRWSRFEETGE